MTAHNDAKGNLREVTEEGSVTVRAVSYTHLDVYKRQVCERDGVEEKR